MSVPSQRLSSGYDMPLVGLGTWMANPGVVGNAVREALLAGYRHIDCAHAYQNQAEIGEVFHQLFVEEKKIKRSDVFITSKVWNTYHSYGKAKEGIDAILHELRLDYVDLMLIHWPMGYEEGGEFFPKDGAKMRYSNVDYLDTWKALEEAVQTGKIRSIGLSNFNHNQIKRVIENSTIKPAVLQVELHPYFQQKELQKWVKENNITLVAYSSLGNPSMPFRKAEDPNIMENETVKRIADELKKSPAQVILRWAIQHNIHVIPKSTNADRIKSNADLFSFELSAEQMKQIDELDKGWRILDLSYRDSDHPHFPFKDGVTW